jgi:phosphoribosylformimino-5-aminoimidazole carboxamide ribotide isomerase
VNIFRPCIDLHDGKVKQIVGSTLHDDGTGLATNFIADNGAEYYAHMFSEDQLVGAHVIQLGPGNEAAAELALAAYPDGLQLGGGVNPSNAESWLSKGAAKVIVTSWLFVDGSFREDRLDEIVHEVGKDRLVIDLSCKARDGRYFVATDRWQRWTDFEVTQESLQELSQYCAEFLIHGVDVEGLGGGMDRTLVDLLAEWTPIPTTYAGGAKDLSDLQYVADKGQGRLGLTIGSALDLFGGAGVCYADAVAWDKARSKHT